MPAVEMDGGYEIPQQCGEIATLETVPSKETEIDTSSTMETDNIVVEPKENGEIEDFETLTNRHGCTSLRKQSSPVEEEKNMPTDVEISVGFVQSYFESYPEKPAEETLTLEQLPEIIKTYFYKCQQKVNAISEGLDLVRKARIALQWQRHLCDISTIQELATQSEGLLLEYEISINERKSSRPRQTSPEASDILRKLTEAVISASKIEYGHQNQDEKQPGAQLRTKDAQFDEIYSCIPPEEGIEIVVANYYYAELIEEDLMVNLEKCEAEKKRSKKEKPASKVEEGDEKKPSHMTRPFALPAREINLELDYIRTLKIFLRAILLWIKRNKAVTDIMEKKMIESKNENTTKGEKSNSTDDPLPASSTTVKSDEQCTSQSESPKEEKVGTTKNNLLIQGEFVVSEVLHNAQLQPAFVQPPVHTADGPKVTMEVDEDMPAAKPEKTY